MSGYPITHPLTLRLGFASLPVCEVLGELVCGAEVLSKPFEKITVV
jgi:hypothetical protein